jgi:hypothetical protein
LAACEFDIAKIAMLNRKFSNVFCFDILVPFFSSFYELPSPSKDRKNNGMNGFEWKRERELSRRKRSKPL